MNQRIANPKCRDGKHANCDGHGWDIDADTAVRCPCACHSRLVAGPDPKVSEAMRLQEDLRATRTTAWEADLP